MSDEMEYSLDEILEMAVCDGIIVCAYCGNGPLEPDFNICPECGQMNVLQSAGVI